MIRRAALVLACIAALPARAEVSVDRMPSGEVRAHFEPGAMGPWQRLRAGVPDGDLLNGSGDTLGHSWPRVYDNAATGLPDAVWSTGGEDGDILLARHDGRGWQPALRLSAVNGTDTLPAVAVDEHGNRFIAWSRSHNARESVHFVAVPGSNAGTTEVVEISSRPRQGRLPSVAVGADGYVYVAYEEASGPNDSTIAIAIDRVFVPKDPGGHVGCSGEIPIDVARIATFTTSLSGTSRAADVGLQATAGGICATWRDSDTQNGSSCLVDGEFGAPEYSP